MIKSGSKRTERINKKNILLNKKIIIIKIMRLATKEKERVSKSVCKNKGGILWLICSNRSYTLYACVQLYESHFSALVSPPFKLLLMFHSRAHISTHCVCITFCFRLLYAILTQLFVIGAWQSINGVVSLRTLRFHTDFCVFILRIGIIIKAII